MSQEQIDKLIHGIKTGDTAITINWKYYICRYCGRILKFYMEGDITVPKIVTHSGCRKNTTGHCYYSKDYLVRIKSKGMILNNY